MVKMAEPKSGANVKGDVSIRRAALDDLDALVQLRLAMLDELLSQDAHTNVQKLAAANRRYFAQKIPDGGYVGWVAEAGDQIVSTGGLVPFEKPPGALNLSGIEAYVMNVYTIPAWRGRGIATQLVEAMVAYARTTPIRRLWLRATPAGARIYQKAGFTDQIEMELQW
jgi:GNAT superfamily N-acetyltransferase